MSKAQEKRDRSAEALKYLRQLIQPGDTIHTVLRHTSRSGMSRRIDLYSFKGKGNEKIFLTGYAARVMDMRWDRDNGGIIIGGCGMDMGFSLVYSLSHTLWPKGVPCTGSNGYTKRRKPSKRPRCRSNDHSNHGDPMYAYKRGQIHSDGGYALRQEWV